jgi:hypothetical protein
MGGYAGKLGQGRENAKGRGQRGREERRRRNRGGSTALYLSFATWLEGCAGSGCRFMIPEFVLMLCQLAFALKY